MRKDLNYYMGLNYPIAVERYVEDDGQEYFSLEIPDLPGCGATGISFEEAINRLEASKELWLEESLSRGLCIDEPLDEDDFSGKFLLRIPARLHMNLSKRAKGQKLSLNQYVKSQLEQSDSNELLLKYMQKQNRKLIDKINSQTKAIGRLERRIESLESQFQPTYPRQICDTGFVTDSKSLTEVTSSCLSKTQSDPEKPVFYAEGTSIIPLLNK